MHGRESARILLRNNSSRPTTVDPTQPTSVRCGVGEDATLVTNAALVGRPIGDRLPKRTIRFGAAALFAVFGLVLLADAQR
jgi:hypothetical protein